MDVQKELWPGWETVGVLGAGGFGSVYEIQRNVFGRRETAALKTICIPQHAGEIEELRQEGYDNASITARFHSYLEDIVREYNMMAELKGCANIVYCDDLRYVQHEDGFGWDLYIKMELLTPLLKALPPRATEEQVIQLGIDMCNALALCRSKNIVHRDIKPQNIFVSNLGDFKLGDFGIAKTSERTASGTKTGTYKFMAPEVYNNQPYGISVDQYSLGLVLYWLLNERRSPFVPLPPAVPRPGDEEEARYRRMSGQPIPEPMFGSRELKKIVLKACAFNPADRFSTPEEMRSALQALQNRTGTPLHLEEEDETEGTVGIHLGRKFAPPQPPVTPPQNEPQKKEDDTQRPGRQIPAQEPPKKDPPRSFSEIPTVDLDIRTTVELSREQAMSGCAVVVTLPLLGEKIRIQVPAGIQDGQTLRVAGRGRTDTLSGLAGSLLVTVKIIPEKEPPKDTGAPVANYTFTLTAEEMKNGVVKIVNGGQGSVAIPAGVKDGQELILTATGPEGSRKVKVKITSPADKPRVYPKKPWSAMSDEELRAYVAFKKGVLSRVWLSILVFFVGIFVGIGVLFLGYALWFLAIYLVVEAVIISRNAKKAEQEYFKRRKQ